MVTDNLFYDSGRQHAPKPNDRLNNSRRTATVQRFIIMMLMMIAGVCGVWGQTTVFLWQHDGSTTYGNGSNNGEFAMSGASIGSATFATYEKKKTSNDGTIIYNAAVTDTDLKPNITNGCKLGNDGAHIKIAPASGKFLKGDIIYICAYNAIMVTKVSGTPSSTSNVRNATNLSGNNGLATGSAKSDLNVGSITLDADLADGENIYISRQSNSVTIAAIKVVRPGTQALSISTQPTGDTYTQGATATALSVAATGGTTPYSYQWYSNTTNSNTGGTAIDDVSNGSNTASYTHSTATVGTTYYYCVVTDSDNPAATVTSNAVAVTVTAPASAPTITQQPIVNNNLKNYTLAYGMQNVTPSAITLEATDASSYQWYSNTTDSNTGGTLINGAESATYTPPTTATGTTYYYCVVTNGAGSITSNTVRVDIAATSSLTTIAQGGSWTPSLKMGANHLVYGGTVLDDNVLVLGNSGDCRVTLEGTSGSAILRLNTNSDYIKINVPAKSTITVTARSGANSNNMTIGPDGSPTTYDVSQSTATAYTYNTDAGGDIYIHRVQGVSLEIYSIAVAAATVPNAPVFNPASGSLVQNSSTVSATSSTSGSTVYYMWDQNSTATFTVGNTTGWTAGTADAATASATAPNATGTYYLHAVAVKDNIASTVSNQEYTITTTQAPTLSWSANTATATIGGSFTAPTLTKSPAGLAVTYTSTDENVATVDNTGAVTIVGAGTTTITAYAAAQTVEGTAYTEATASYTLTVSAATSITLVSEGAWVFMKNGSTASTSNGNTEIPSSKPAAGETALLTNTSGQKMEFSSSSGLSLSSGSYGQTVNGISATGMIKLKDCWLHVKVAPQSKITIYASGTGNPGRPLYVGTSSAVTSSDNLATITIPEGNAITSVSYDWTGNAATDLYFLASSQETRIVAVTVEPLDQTKTYTINVEDLRYPHLTYDAQIVRKGIEGFDISYSGWQSQVDNFYSGPYSVMPTSDSGDHTITLTPNSSNSTVTIKQITLIGAAGAFSGVKVTNGTVNSDGSEATVVFDGESGNAAALTAGDAGAITITDARPKVTAIEVVTDKATTSAKQNVVLSYADGSGEARTEKSSVPANNADYYIGVQVYAAIGGETAVPFRQGAGSVINNNTDVGFVNVHLSSSNPPNQVGVSTGKYNGDATLVSQYEGNKYYNQATSANYVLHITGGVNMAVTEESDYLWVFDKDDVVFASGEQTIASGSTQFYKEEDTPTDHIIELGGQINTKGQTSPYASADGVDATGRAQMKTGSYIHFKMAPHTKAYVYTTASQAINMEVYTGSIGAADEGTKIQSGSTNSSTAYETEAYTNNSDNAVDVYVVARGQTINLFGVKVETAKTATGIRLGGGQSEKLNPSYSTDANNPNTINGLLALFTEPSGIITNATTVNTEALGTLSGSIIDPSKFTITTSDASIANVGSVNFTATSGSASPSNRFAINNIIIGTKGGTATITVKYNGNATYDESNVMTFVVTVNGPQSFNVVANDQTVQLKQKGTFSPYITDSQGNQLMIIDNGDNGTHNYEIRAIDEEEGEKCDYTEFFDFSYTPVDADGTGTGWAYITVDATTGEISTVDPSDSDNFAADGAKRSFTITATPKTGIGLEGYFNGSATTTAEVEITSKNNKVTVDFFWDENLTIPVTQHTDWELGKDGTDLSRTVIFGKTATYCDNTATNFQNGFPNGRMVYAKVNTDNVTPGKEGGNIYFSIARNTTAKSIESKPSSSESGVYLYRRGIPLVRAKNGGTVSDGDYISLIVVYVAPDGSVDGAVSKCQFNLKAQTSETMPPIPTYSPTSYPNVSGTDADTKEFSTKINKQTTSITGRVMDTSESVVAYGEGASDGHAGNGNLVFGKFSTSTEYETEQLINENSVKFNYDNVPVISTEVAARRFTSVQIRKVSNDIADNGGYGEYVSAQTLTYYWYEFDTQMTLTKNGKSFSETSIYTQNSLDKVPVAFSAKDSVNYVVTWINKGHYNYQGSPERQEVLSYYKTMRKAQGNDLENYYYIDNNGDSVTVDANRVSLITYEIINWSNRGDGNNGTNANANKIATINTATGLVTAGTEPGWVTVAVKYAGGETHGGSSSNKKDNNIDEPQYTSTTAPTLTTFTVYVNEAGKEAPTITPTSRKFTQSQTYTIKAPKSWDVYYTLDGTTPAVGTGTYLAHGQSFTSATTSTITVKAIAYDPENGTTGNTSYISNVVSETYTKVDPLPDPYFDPDGVPSPWYYYTSTLKVDIADAYSGAQIFYTLDGSDPTPDYSNASTVRYSGQEKLIISGNKSIKAIAFVRLDDGSELYSNIVTSNYIYTTDMPRPYFVIKYKNTNQWLAPDASATADSYGNKVQNWTGVTVKGWQDGETVYVDRDTRIMVVNPADGGVGTTYYTLDGSTPNEENSIRFTGATDEDGQFYVIKTTIGTAFVMYEGATSKTGTAVFTPVAGTDFHCWEAVPATTPGGVLNASTRVISTNQSKVSASDGKLGTGVLWDTGVKTYDKSAHEFAQEGITVTFGGFDNAAWTTPDIGQKGEGTPVDGVGQYSIRAGDVATEINASDGKALTFGKYEAFQNICAATTTYAKSFGLPAQGGFVKFEPEKNGYLAIYLVQQGALHFQSGAKYTTWYDKMIKRRAVYLIDEQGKTVAANPDRSKTTATLNENWGEWISNRDANPSYYPAFVGKDQSQTVNAGTDEEETHKESYYTVEQCNALFDFYYNAIKENNWTVGSRIRPLNIHKGTVNNVSFTAKTTANNGVNRGYTSESDGVYGYVLPSNGYVKYVFPVEAGKTYFFLGDFTKIGIRGFNFVPGDLESGGANADNATTLAINENNGPSVTNGTKVRATLTRTVGNADSNGDTSHSFKANTWAAIVLPFSVSSTKVEEIFGAGTEIIHFRGIDVVPNQSFTDQPTVNFEQHWHRMIIAGVPCLIKPAQDVASTINFGNVKVEAEAVVPVTSSSTQYGVDFTMTGSYAPSTIFQNTMYIGNDGKLYQLTKADNAAVKGTRAWITGAQGSLMANEMPVFITDYNGEWYQDYDSDLITLIQGIADDMNARENGTLNGREGVYTLGGQLVRRDATDLSGLASGVYIVNGKKMVIK
ncbi:MAG: chitobiase/beta-hexosaminidase C-terminal domain-containing protein [Prevotella sp.]|nr:chitobiase/beta-hexosaminidase C-terminal domain-containing protein [Prevotella sp.]